MAYSMPPPNFPLGQFQPNTTQHTSAHARTRYLAGLVRFNIENVKQAILHKMYPSVVAWVDQVHSSWADLCLDLQGRGYPEKILETEKKKFYGVKAKMHVNAKFLANMNRPDWYTNCIKKATYILDRASEADDIMQKLCTTTWADVLYSDQHWYHAWCSECITNGKEFPVPPATEGQIEPPPNPFLKDSQLNVAAQEFTPGSQLNVAAQEFTPAVHQLSMTPQVMGPPSYPPPPYEIAVQQSPIVPQAIAVHQPPILPQAVVVHQPSIAPQAMALQYPAMVPVQVPQYSTQPQVPVQQYSAPAQVPVQQYSAPAQVPVQQCSAPAQVPDMRYPPPQQVLQNQPEAPIKEMAAMTFTDQLTDHNYARQMGGTLLFHIERLQDILNRNALTKQQQKDLVLELFNVWKSWRKVIGKFGQSFTSERRRQLYIDFEKAIYEVYNCNIGSYESLSELNTLENVDKLLRPLNKLHESFIWFCQNRWVEMLYGDQDWCKQIGYNSHRVPIPAAVEFQPDEPPQPNPCSVCGKRLCFACTQDKYYGRASGHKKLINIDAVGSNDTIFLDASKVSTASSSAQEGINHADARYLCGNLRLEIERLIGILDMNILTKKQQSGQKTKVLRTWKRFEEMIRKDNEKQDRWMYLEAQAGFKDAIEKFYTSGKWDASYDQNSQDNIDIIMPLLKDVHNKFFWFCQHKWGDILYADQAWYGECRLRSHRIPVPAGAESQVEPPEPNPCTVCGNKLCFACQEN